MATKRPDELTVGDVFTPPSGPHAGKRMRVVLRPRTGQYGTVAVAARNVAAETVTMEPDWDLKVDDDG